MKNIQGKSKIVTLVVVAALVLSIGTVSAFAIANTDSWREVNADGWHEVTPEEYEALKAGELSLNDGVPRFWNGGVDTGLFEVGEEILNSNTPVAEFDNPFATATVSRVKPENVVESYNDDGTVGLRMYVNLDENNVPVDLTEEEWQEVFNLLQPRDENGNIIPHVCDENCKYPVEIADAPDGYTTLNRSEGIQPGV